jgi:hypothetical protein
MSWSDLDLRRSRNAAGDLVVRFGVAVLDGYLEFLAVRSRPNTVVAVDPPRKFRTNVQWPRLRRTLPVQVLVVDLVGSLIPEA